MRREVIREVVGTLVVVAILAVFGWVGMTIAAQATDSNQVGYWCDDGIKIEDPGTPFVVPEPPEGTTWTLLILKAGLSNKTITPVIVGQAYSHPSGREISHVILCYEPSSPGSTTSTSVSTPTTSAPTTTTTDPATTTSSSTTTTKPTTTTTSVASSTSSTTPPVSAVPPSIPIPKGVNAGEAPTGQWSWARTVALIVAAWVALAGLAWVFIAGGTRRRV